ncbi:MAG: bifunctional 3-demethylubiquinone-9 3-methyltransferase/2-octaprenyl-6-hydroxy phenol methylase [Bacteroidota bacterium]|jgi:ubiquinone/menaquinone biosynthesis C-methylase UbiE|nr:bifunctional 3-demethylubiquinone-9 3-methyltransferase/2-octaprenyl-6-hydroxy phenol methylase [Bacteroidota bacterium]
MENFDKKGHWENIYQTKQLNNVSWYQPIPETSLELIESSGISKDSHIIDIGGGDSYLVDALLERGYKNITVLDISETALDKAKIRLGNKASKVKWLVRDAGNFSPDEKYDLWHDRAAFHFLTNDSEIKNYFSAVYNSLNPGGTLIIGTFSESGPTKCSGIEVRQYSEQSISQLFKKGFRKIACTTIDHQTPFDTNQNFLFCSFLKE